MSIEEVADELYGLAPEEFTRARNTVAKEARASGDTQLAARVQSLRKPTTGAWLLNQLVRRHVEEVAQVLDLGARLRAAQGTLGAEEVRDLDRQRRQLTHAVAQRARTLALQGGRRVSDQAVADVEETLRSAMVDAAAGAALSSGRLTDTFSSTGLEPVDLSRALALAGPTALPLVAPSVEEPPTVDRTPDPGLERRLARARQAVAEAESALAAAVEEAERAGSRAAHARRERGLLESAREEARGRLADLDAQVAAAVEASDGAARLHDRAARDEAAAVEEAEQLREQLERLESGAGLS